MTAYALYGLVEARRAGYQVEEYRITNGARALASMYAEYPRAEPDLKAYHGLRAAARPAGRRSDSVSTPATQPGSR